MAPDLKPGRRALYKSLPGEVLELVGHDSAMVDLGEFGIVEVQRSELIAIAEPNEVRESSLAAIPEDVWAEARRRALAVRRIAAVELGRSDAVRQSAIELGLSERQLWRLIKDYESHQTVSGMRAQPTGRKVGTKVLDLAVERIIANKIDTYYLAPERPTVKALTERIATACREANLNPPNGRTISRRLESYQDRASQMRRMGSKQAKYTFEPMPGHVEVSAPLERVEIDHTPLDVIVRSDDPYCDYVGRPWLTVAIDVYTRCVLGMHIGFEPPSVLSVALCVTHAVLPKNPAAEFGVPEEWPMHGLPKEIVVDNAKEFISPTFRRGCDEHNIILSTRPIGAPHYGGTIERLIGTMVGQCHLLPGTTKNSVKAKGDYDSVKHAVMTLRGVRRWFVEQLLGRYHVKEHRMLRIPPLVAWMRSQEGGS